MYLEKGAVLLGQHHQITFGNILVTTGCNAKVRALILCSCKMLNHSVSPFLGRIFSNQCPSFSSYV